MRLACVWCARRVRNDNFSSTAWTLKRGIYHLSSSGVLIDGFLSTPRGLKSGRSSPTRSLTPCLFNAPLLASRVSEGERQVSAQWLVSDSRSLQPLCFSSPSTSPAAYFPPGPFRATTSPHRMPLSTPAGRVAYPCPIPHKR